MYVSHRALYGLKRWLCAAFPASVGLAHSRRAGIQVEDQDGKMKDEG